MRFAQRPLLLVCSALAASAAWLFACSGDDSKVASGSDAGHDAASNDGGGGGDSGGGDSKGGGDASDGSSQQDTGGGNDGSTTDGGGNDSGSAGDAFVVLVGPNGQTAFDPQMAMITVGETVEWQWQSSGHSVTSGDSNTCTPDNAFCSPNDQNCAAGTTSSSGAKYRHTFLEAGTFDYFCVPHCQSGMTGQVMVQ